jgi:TolA-binding protein
MRALRSILLSPRSSRVGIQIVTVPCGVAPTVILDHNPRHDQDAKVTAGEESKMSRMSREVLASSWSEANSGIAVHLPEILASLVVIVLMARGSIGQEARQRAGQDRGAAARSVPDALKFAHGLLRQRKFDLAAEEYDRFLATGPKGQDRIDALFGLGNARLYQGRHEDARRALESFLKEAPADLRSLTARYRLGEVAYLMGDLPAARQALETFTATKADHPALETAWTYLGDVCYGSKDLAGAKTAYERSLSKFPRGRLAGRARYGLARTLAGLGEPDRALRELHELTQSGGPEWVDRAWLQIGAIHQSAGRFAEVVEAMTSLERAARESVLKHEAWLRRAQALHRLGRPEEAVVFLERLSGPPAGPLSVPAALELSTIELERNQPAAALATLEAVMKRSPQSPLMAAVQFRSAEALWKLKRLPEAQERFLQVVETAPEDVWADDALRRAAQTALERGDAPTARKLAGQFAVKFPRSPLLGDVRLIEARAAAKAGDPRVAASILEPLLNPPPGSKEGSSPSLSATAAQDARYELALAYRALGRSAEADALLARLSESTNGPVAADALFLLGQEHVEAGRFAQAIGPLERYLAANPRGDVAEFALADLAVAQLGAGRADDAWKTLAVLAERFPAGKALPRTRVRVAEAALAAHQPERAAEQFRLVVPSSPNGEGIDPAIQARALAGLGRALSDLKQPADAAKAFAAFLELAPDDPTAPEIALAQARALESANQSGEALAAFERVAKRYGETGPGLRAVMARARLLSRLGRHAEAAAAFERLVTEPHLREPLAKAGMAADAVLAEWGWSLVDAAKPAEADRVFSRLLSEYPQGPYVSDARFNLAESAYQEHRYPDVIRLLSPLVARAAKSDGAAPPARLLPAVLYRLGRAQVDVQDWAGAAATLDRLLSEFPDSSYRREARFLRAESALKTGDAAAAEGGFSALLDEPAGAKDPPAFRRVVRLKQIQAWVVLKRWKPVLEAIPSLRAELPEGDPAIPEVDYARGQALMGLGRLEEARAAFQSVIDAKPGNELAAQAQLMRGETYFHEDRRHEALREFLRVDILYNAPHWQAAALLEAGKVYERLDQWADAAETYERLLARFPADPDAALARARRDAANRRVSSTSKTRR